MTQKVSPISAQPDATNPLQPTSFRFFLQRTPEVTYFCQTANIPGISVPAVVQSNVFSDIKQPGDRVEFEDLTIQFIVNEDLGNWLEIKNWMTSTAPYDSIDDSSSGRVKDDIEDATLVILNSNLNERFRVNFRGVFPTNLTAIEMNSTVSDMEPLTATVTFSYTDYEIEAL
jgi:hypothetical protein